MNTLANIRTIVLYFKVEPKSQTRRKQSQHTCEVLVEESNGMYHGVCELIQKLFDIKDSGWRELD